MAEYNKSCFWDPGKVIPAKRNHSLPGMPRDELRLVKFWRLFKAVQELNLQSPKLLIFSMIRRY